MIRRYHMPESHDHKPENLTCNKRLGASLGMTNPTLSSSRRQEEKVHEDGTFSSKLHTPEVDQKKETEGSG